MEEKRCRKWVEWGLTAGDFSVSKSEGQKGRLKFPKHRLCFSIQGNHFRSKSLETTKTLWVCYLLFQTS